MRLKPSILKWTAVCRVCSATAQSISISCESDQQRLFTDISPPVNLNPTVMHWTKHSYAAEVTVSSKQWSQTRSVNDYRWWRHDFTGKCFPGCDLFAVQRCLTVNHQQQKLYKMHEKMHKTINQLKKLLETYEKWWTRNSMVAYMGHEPLMPELLRANEAVYMYYHDHHETLLSDVVFKPYMYHRYTSTRVSMYVNSSWKNNSAYKVV